MNVKSYEANRLEMQAAVNDKQPRLHLYFSLHQLPSDLLSPKFNELLKGVTLLLIENGFWMAGHALLERRINEVLRGEKEPDDVTSHIPPSPTTPILCAIIQLVHRHPSLKRVVMEHSPITEAENERFFALSQEKVDRWNPQASQDLHNILNEQASIVRKRDEALAEWLKNNRQDEPYTRTVAEMGYGHRYSLPKCLREQELYCKDTLWIPPDRAPALQLELIAKLAAGDSVTDEQLEDALTERTTFGGAS